MNSFKHTFQGEKHDVPNRDTQRQRVYDAENELEIKLKSKLPDTSLESTQAYVNNVVSSATWKRLRAQHGMTAKDGSDWISNVTVKDGRGCRWARGGSNRVTLPVWARTKLVILHELAHVLVGNKSGHNWPFTRAFIDLVAVFMSKEDALNLEQKFKKHKVRFRPKRKMSAEAKAALAQRGRNALAVYSKREVVGESRPGDASQMPTQSDAAPGSTPST